MPLTYRLRSISKHASLLGAISLCLGGCIAAPLAQLAYQAATTPGKPCSAASGNTECGSSPLSSAINGLTQASQQLLGGPAGR